MDSTKIFFSFSTMSFSTPCCSHVLPGCCHCRSLTREHFHLPSLRTKQMASLYGATVDVASCEALGRHFDSPNSGSPWLGEHNARVQ